MKSVLVIGLGRFGRHMALKFMALGNEVFAIDTKENIVNDIAADLTRAEIGDCTREAYMSSLGVRDFDLCVCAIGDNFQASLEIVALLKDLGAQFIVARAHSEVHEKFLLRNGADAVIYPERETSENGAVQYSMDNIFDYIDLGDDYSIVEIPTPKRWIGRSIIELDVRSKFGISILAAKRDNRLSPTISPKHLFDPDESLIIMGRLEDVQALSRDWA